MTARAGSWSAWLMVLAIHGCTGEPHRDVQQRYGNGTEKVVRTYRDRNDTARYTLEEFYPTGAKRVKGLADSDTVDLISWYENGQVEAEWRTVKGLEDGPIRCWHPNGRLKKTLTLVLEEPNGTERRWHENGRPEYAATFLNGRKTGRTHFWSETGRYVSRTYVNDTLEGPTIEIDSIGGRVVGQYRNDLEEGRWTWMDSTNKFIRAKNYHAGEVLPGPGE